MKTIYKYPLHVKDLQELALHGGAKVLTVMMQDNVLTLWAEVDTDCAPVRRTFEVFGTGNPMSYDMGVERQYIASVQERMFVWHIYERLN